MIFHVVSYLSKLSKKYKYLVVANMINNLQKIFFKLLYVDIFSLPGRFYFVLCIFNSLILEIKSLLQK